MIRPLRRDTPPRSDNRPRNDTSQRGQPDSMIETVQLDSGPVTVHWRVSPRARRLSMRIDPRAGHVIVTLPPRASRLSGRTMVRNNAGWIATHLADLPSRIDFAEGAMVPLDGIAHRVRHDPDARSFVRVEGDVLVVSGEAQFLPRRLAEFMRAEARRRLSAHVTRIAAAIERRPRRLSIKDVRSRWGSCTADGVVMLSWRLVMAPVEVQDYVVAHELAHLRHMDHSADFWAEVVRLTPHREMAERWLRENGPALLRIG